MVFTTSLCRRTPPTSVDLPRSATITYGRRRDLTTALDSLPGVSPPLDTDAPWTAPWTCPMALTLQGAAQGDHYRLSSFKPIWTQERPTKSLYTVRDFDGETGK